MLYLSDQDIACIVRRVTVHKIMDDIISACQESFKAARTPYKKRDGFLISGNLVEWMPVLTKSDEVTIKLVCYFPENPNIYQKATIQSKIAHFCKKSGTVDLLADGKLITAMRTGAASAIASRYLAKPDSHILGIVGCGAQAVTQIHALTRDFAFSQILACDIDPQVQLTLAARLSLIGIHIPITFATAHDILRQSDIICTATSVAPCSEPVIPDGVDYVPHLHINAVGSDCPDKTELPQNLLSEAFIVPDSIEQAQAEGECQKIDSMPEYDIFDIVQSSMLKKDQLSIFDSTGLPLEDALALEIFKAYAEDMKLGKKLEGEIQQDAKNPYDLVYMK